LLIYVSPNGILLFEKSGVVLDVLV